MASLTGLQSVLKAPGILAVHPAQTLRELPSDLSVKRTVESLKFERFQARQVIGVLTRHCYLESHLLQLGTVDSSICGRCHSEAEKVSHAMCEPLAELRLQYLGTHFRNQVPMIKFRYVKILYS